jgi:hypothetical protein
VNQKQEISPICPSKRKPPDQKIKRLEKELEDEKLKALIFKTMIDTSDEQYRISIQKKYLSKQLGNSSKKKK